MLVEVLVLFRRVENVYVYKTTYIMVVPSVELLLGLRGSVSLFCSVFCVVQSGTFSCILFIVFG